jgi:hypothetical protein
VTLSPDVPAFLEYYEREALWPAASLARRLALQRRIEAHRASGPVID